MKPEDAAIKINPVNEFYALFFLKDIINIDGLQNKVPNVKGEVNQK